MQTSTETSKLTTVVRNVACKFLLFAFAIIFSFQTKGQATCVAVIDGSATEFCVTSGSITFANAVASGANVEWITSGDGTFSNRFAQNPTYTPGPADIAKGSAFIYLDVYKDDPVDFCSQLPVVTLRVGNLGATATPATQSICTASAITTIQLAGAASGTTYNWVRNNTANVTGIAASGTGNITGTLTNSTGAPVMVTFTITPTSATCSGTPVTATVTVSPKPNATASIASQSTCSGATIIPVTVTGSVSGATYNWTRNNTATVTGIAASGSGNIAGLLTKTSGTTSTTVTFTITPTLSGCNGTAITSTVSVSPTAVVASGTPSSQSICSGTVISSIAITGGTTWTRNNTTTVTGIAASGSGGISGVLTSTSAVPEYVTFTVNPTSGSCPNRATVIVNPAPSATPSTVSQTICSGATITPVTLSGSMAGTTFSWTRNNTASATGIAASGTGNISGALTNTTNAPVTVTFTIIPTANGCNGAATTTTVIVNPIPTAVITGSQAVCTGGALPTLSIVFTGTAPWNFTYTDGTIPFTVNNNSNNPYTFTVPAATKTYTLTSLTGAACAAQPAGLTGSAIISQLVYGITASAGSGGNITPNGTTNINCGTNQTYTITPNTGAIIQDVIVDGVSAGAVSSYTFTNVTAAHTISVSFTASSWIINATAGANGNITPASAVSVTNAASQTFAIASSSNCYQIADVLVDGVSVGAVPSYTFTNVTAAHTISASFSLNTYGITASAGANGTITPAGATNINCGANQTYNIAAGSCYQIADVLVDGVSVGAVPSYTFTNVTAAHTISASFSLRSYAIAATAGANGTITPSGSANINCGSNQTYTIAAASSCYQVADVLVDGMSVGAVPSYTFTNVTATHTISASFSLRSYAIIASAGANGTVTPAGTTNATCGSNQTYSIAATAGFIIQDVLVDGVSAGAVSAYTFTNVTAAHSISASFVTAPVGCTAPTLSTSITNILCANSSTGAINLTTAGGTAPFTYSWTGPNGFTANTEDITGALAGTYNVTVTATGGCSANGTATITQPAALTATAAAVTIACNATTTTLQTTAAGGASGTRQYSLNGGAFVSTPNFTVAASATPYIVTVKDPNGCTTNSNSVTVTVATTVPSAATAVDGPVYGLCGGGNFIYTAQPVAGAVTYTWSVPTGWSIVSGQNTAQAVINVPANFTGSQGIWTTPKNGCGTGTGFRLAVSAVQSFAASILAGPAIVTSAQSGVQYSVPASAGTTYNWLVPTGAAVTAGQGTNSITVTFGTASGNVSVDITNGCGTGPRVTKAVTVSSGTITFNITASAGANGSITPSGVTAVANNNNQTYTIVPVSSCYQIANVLVDGVSVGAVPSYTFTNVTAAHTISASFSLRSYAIAASAGANGTVTPAGTTTANCGSNQTYTIAAASNCYQVADVLVDGVSVGAVSSYTFTNVTAAHTISASFSLRSYAIAASAGANGTVTPAGTTNATCGSNQTYSIAATAGFIIQDVLVDGVSAGAVSAYTFTNVTATHSISASFVATSGCTAPTLSTSITNILCANSSTGAITLTTIAGTAPTTYAWTGPNGFTASTKDISGVVAGTYNYVVTTPGGCSASGTATITQPAALTATAAAVTIACNATTTTLQTTATGGTSGTRQYSLNGAAYVSSPNFTVAASGTPYIVTVKDPNGCTVNSNSVTVTVATTVPSAATAVDGPVYGLCGGGNFIYTAQPVAGAVTYTWSVPTGWSIVSGQNTAQAVITVPANFTGSQGIWATPKNGCGSGTGFRLAVSAVQSFAAASLTGPASATPGQSGVQYSVPASAGTTYNWLVPTGAAVTAGQGTNSITVTFGTASGNVSVDITNGCGTGPRVTKAVTVGALARPSASVAARTKPTATTPVIEEKTVFNVYPNPAQNDATVVFNSLKTGSQYEVVICNSLGKILFAKTGTANAGANIVRLDMTKFIDGMYLVRLRTGEETTVQKLMKAR